MIPRIPVKDPTLTARSKNTTRTRPLFKRWMIGRRICIERDPSTHKCRRSYRCRLSIYRMWVHFMNFEMLHRGQQIGDSQPLNHIYEIDTRLAWARSIPFHLLWFFISRVIFCRSNLNILPKPFITAFYGPFELWLLQFFSSIRSRSLSLTLLFPCSHPFHGN